MGTSEPARVLVTGATGGIGRHVVSELVARGYQVRALTSKSVPETAVSAGLEWHHHDFLQSLDFDAAVKGCAAVLHLGAELTQIDRMERSNVAATRALAEASERAGVKIFCYTSSVAVYGSSRRRKVLENSPVLTADHDVPAEYWVDQTLRCYGRTKLQSELAIAAVSRNIEYVILRPTVAIDMGDLRELRAWHKAKKHKASSRRTHHIYVRDVADAILWFMERSLRRESAEAGVSVFNLSEDDTPINTYGKVFRAAYAVTDEPSWRFIPLPWPVEWLWGLLRIRALPPRWPFGQMIFPNDKLRETGYEFRFGIEHLVRRYLEELRAGSAPTRES